MGNVKYSVAFNVKQILKQMQENGLTSIAVATTSRSDKAVRAIGQALVDALIADGKKAVLSEASAVALSEGVVSIAVCADLLRRVESVAACEICGAVVFVERYGVTTHRKLDEALDVLRVQNSNVLGVIAVK